jgi:hypothetical protein
MRRWLWVALIILALAGTALPVRAQQSVFDVFVNSNISKGKAGLFFVDARTGLSRVVVTDGTRHTLLESGVLFQENTSGAIKVAYPSGQIEPFDALQPSKPDSTVRWVVSANRKHIVWTITQMTNNTLLNDLYTANSDGSEKKPVLHTSSTRNIDTVPLSITNDGLIVFYSRQPKTPGDYRLFPVAGDIFLVDVITGQTGPLPDEAKCACAVTFSADGHLFARLETNGGNGFGLRLWDLSINLSTAVAAPALSHTQAGYPLLSREGGLVIYTSARGVSPARGVPPERFVLVLADISKREQKVLTAPLVNNLRAVAFEPDNSAVLLVGVDKDGTYKLSLKDGTLLQVSAYTFLGTL